jgi:hypothetical protein
VVVAQLCEHTKIFIEFYSKKTNFKPGMMVPFYSPSIWETKAGGSQVWGKPELQSETIYQNTKQNK